MVAWPAQRAKKVRIVATVKAENLSLGALWLHIVAKMACIGSLFRFVHRDLSLKSSHSLTVRDADHAAGLV
ncbi:MAG: hypothetical protein ABSF41_10465 [Pseudolabrys sp.]